MLDNIPGFDFSLPKLEAKKKKLTVSDDFKRQAKTFLDKLDIRCAHFKRQSFIIVKNVMTDVSLPLLGEQFRIRTQRQINLISLIIKIAYERKKIDEITITTYTLNREAWGVLIDLLSTHKLKKLSLIIPKNYHFRHKEYCQEIKRTAITTLKRYDFHLVFADVHLKLTLIRCGSDYFQIEGSMNYSMNNMAEQLLFENNKESYQYDYNFIHEIITKKKLGIEKVC